MRRGFISFILGLTMMTTGAWAGGGEAGDFEISPFAGYTFLDDYGNTNPNNHIYYGLRLGYFVTSTVSFEPSFQFLKTGNDLPNDMYVYSTRMNLLYNLAPERIIRPFFTVGVGWESTNIDNVLGSNDLGINAGGGLRVFITDYLAARLDGRYVFIDVGDTLNDRQHNAEASLGISFLFGGSPALDSDADSVRDKKDECPETPAGAVVDKEGCPSDSDKDGVFDGIDRCPGTIEGFHVDEKGCMMDADGDAVPDGPDQCPDTPKGMPVDSKGCSKDKDGDGVTDKKDECPDTPVGVTVDEKGCPLDSDGDKVADHLDKCPDTKADTEVDAKGCPVVHKARGVLKGVTFKFGSAELAAASKTVLNEVALMLNDFPEVLVEVQGHTDSVGAEQVNLGVSQKRAESVTNYLVSQGVSRDRLVPRGYGEVQPIATNATGAGRRENRRVELVWLD